VLRNLKVKALYAPQWDQDNELCRRSTALLESGHIPRRILTKGMALSCGPDFLLKVLHPSGNNSFETPNAGSLALTLKYKDITWMLPGDIGREQEELLPDDGLRAEVLAVAHQGSAAPTGDSFLKAVLPRYAVISTSGQRGHPAPETLRRLRRFGVTVFRTDRDGAVTMTTDGVRLQITAARKADRD